MTFIVMREREFAVDLYLDLATDFEDADAMRAGTHSGDPVVAATDEVESSVFTKIGSSAGDSVAGSRGCPVGEVISVEFA